MITFFRKIRQKLLQQNKVGSYLKYANGEIFFCREWDFDCIVN